MIICSGTELKEALQMQLDVQMRLHEQLEVAAQMSLLSLLLQTKGY